MRYSQTKRRQSDGRDPQLFGSSLPTATSGLLSRDPSRQITIRLHSNQSHKEHINANDNVFKDYEHKNRNSEM